MLTNVCGIVEPLQIGHHLMVEKGFLSLYSPHASLVSSLSIQSCLFSVCRMRAALSSPSSIARLYHFLSISSPDEYHSPPPILLSFLFTLCHFCTTLSLLLNLQSRQAALSAPLSLLKQFTLGYLQMHACMRCHEQTLGERLSVHVSRKIER